MQTGLEIGNRGSAGVMAWVGSAAFVLVQLPTRTGRHRRGDAIGSPDGLSVAHLAKAAPTNCRPCPRLPALEAPNGQTHIELGPSSECRPASRPRASWQS